MQGKTHLVVGIATGIAAGFVSTLIISDVKPMIVVGTMIATAIGSIYPDIDNPKSMLGSKTRPISTLINKAFGHRGFIHTPINLLLIMAVGIALCYIGQKQESLPIIFGFSVGVISHLFLDTITKGGIEWLYPFSKKRFNLTRMKSGGALEKAILFLSIAVSGGFAVLKLASVI